jgi:hypothetical protein
MGSNNTVEFSIKIIDNFRKELESFMKGIDSAAKKAKILDTELGKPSRDDPYNNVKKSLSELNERLSRYRSASQNSFRTDHIEKYNMLINETTRQIEELEDATESTSGKTESMFGAFLKANVLMKGLEYGKELIGKGIDFAKESIDASAQIETYEASLKNMLGTTEEARERMQEYFAIAKETPFDLPQVVEAGNKLQALGRYSEDNVKMLGDLAAASGKPMEQALNAYSKMASGQKGIAIDMFRDLMITTDDWTKATGKGVSKSGELLATTEELISALPGILKSKGYLGMMATQAATTEGKMANLGDSVFQLKVALGNQLNPATKEFVNQSSRAVEKLKRWVEIPIEQKIAAEKSELNILVTSLINSNEKEDERKTIIDQLQQRYPDFLKNINLEKATTEELRKELEKVNAEYDKKMRKAAYQRMVDELNEDSAGEMANILKYENSISARDELANVEKKIKDFAQKQGFAQNAESWGIGEDIPVSVLADIMKKGSFNRTSFDAAGRNYMQKNYIGDQATASMLAAEYAVTNEAIKWRDTEKAAGAKEKYDQYKARLMALQKKMNNEFGASSDKETPPNNDDTKTETSTETKIETAAGAITSGGKSVKSITININDGLLNHVNNYFSGTDDQRTMEGFIDKLQAALMGSLNDANTVN